MYYGYATIKQNNKKKFFGAWSREGTVRLDATGVRFKIRIIILTGKTLCISRSTRMVNFRPKTHLERNFFLTDAKATRAGVRTCCAGCAGPHVPNEALAPFDYKPPKTPVA
jgi:hypothetical protein